MFATFSASCGGAPSREKNNLAPLYKRTDWCLENTVLYRSILQKQNKWYALQPSVGIQRKSYSDIQRGVVNYELFTPTK